MGRQPKATALKILEGNPSGRPLPIEPKYSSLSSEPPNDQPEMSLAAQNEWARLAPEMIANGVLTIADQSVFRDYCIAVAHCLELETLILTEGNIITNKNGDKQRHPAILAYQNWQKVKEAARIQLGLTPVSRARVHPATTENKDDNPWGEEAYG